VHGQWIGPYTGTNDGQLVIELDDFGSYSAGSAYAYDRNTQLLGAFAQIRLENDRETQRLQLGILPIDPRTNKVEIWNNIASAFPNQAFPTTATADVTVVSDVEIRVEALTNVGTQINALVSRGRLGRSSDYTADTDVRDWDQFKSFVSTLKPYRCIFRGQDKALRLRTSFHRFKRADISRFVAYDMPMLARHLASRLKHVFNLTIPDENGAFVALTQHHGYPTPLLDWTYSPFVAAFFAFRDVRAERMHDDPEGVVRIFVLDKDSWSKTVPQLPMLRPYGLHFSILDMSAIENERLVPQQAVSTVTNVEDIESYIKRYDTDASRPLLRIIDLPVSDRIRIMSDLSTMGITAGSMFPGLDGACEQLKERNFPLP
jgi:hypothetical protein